MRSARRPPSRRQTGAPSDLPSRSQSAMSTPAIAEIERPRRPSWGSTWPRSSAKPSRGVLYITSQSRLTSRGSCATRSGARSRLMMAARPYPDAALPTPAFASPQPTRPSSVSTFTRTESNEAMRPKSLTCCRSYGIGTWTQVAWTLVIFTGRVSPRPTAAPGGRRPPIPVASSRDPPVPAVAGGGAVLEVRHLDPAQVVRGEIVPLGVHVDGEDPRGVQSEDLLLHRARERPVPVSLHERVGNLEAPEGLDLPLRRPVPDRVRPPQHVVGAEGVDDLAEQVGARGRVRRDELPEGGAQLHVDVPEARLLPLRLAELGGPGDVPRRAGRRHAEQPGVVDEEVDVREIGGRLDQVAWMVVVRNGSEGQSLVSAEAPHAERTGLLEHGIGDLLVVDEPASIEPLGGGPGIRLPGIDLERRRLEVHEVEIGAPELRGDQAMGEHPAGLRDAVDLVADVGHLLRRHHRLLRIRSGRCRDEPDRRLAVEEHLLDEVLPREIGQGPAIGRERRVHPPRPLAQPE